MTMDHIRVRTRDERSRTKLRCPHCNAPLAITWRRVHESGRSEDLFQINKTSCRNGCDRD
jgi:hypothetical protein